MVLRGSWGEGEEISHTEIFSKSYQIKSRSDYISHFPIDLEQQTNAVRFLFQINQIYIFRLSIFFSIANFFRSSIFFDYKFLSKFWVCTTRNLLLSLLLNYLNVIIYTIFRLLWAKRNSVRFQNKKSENDKYYLIPGNFTRTRSRFVGL